MRLCFLAGANSIHSYRWVKYFADRGHEVSWISLSPLSAGSKIPDLEFYELRQYSNKLFTMLRGVYELRSLLKQAKPDVLHAHYAGIYGFIGALSGFHPFIVTAWGSDVLIAARAELKRLLVRHTLKGADLITCDAEHMRNAIAQFGVNIEKIKIVYFGVDTQRFTPGPRNTELMKRSGIVGSPVMISLRNLEPIYDIETLIRCAPRVLMNFPDAEFVVIGTGSQEGKLKKLAQSLAIGGKVQFLGRIINEDIVGYLRTADIYISTALSDAGIAASTAEAMACGLPVIITDSGENRRWVKDGEGGFLVPVKDPESLADRIIYLIRNDEKRLRFGARNREMIVQKNNYFKEMGTMESLYKMVIRAYE